MQFYNQILLLIFMAPDCLASEDQVKIITTKHNICQLVLQLTSRHKHDAWIGANRVNIVLLAIT